MMVHFQKSALLHTLAFCITDLINEVSHKQNFQTYEITRVLCINIDLNKIDPIDD